MVPKEWQIASVSSVCTQVSVGIVVNPSHYYVADGQGVRAFRSGNVRENAVQDSKWVYLSDEGHRKNSKSKLKAGDVLVVRTGFAGTACVVPQEFDGCNCIDILFARPDTSKLVPDYLAQLTNSQQGRRQVLSGQSGLAQKHLNVSSYSKMTFALPPVEEQRRIVQILATWDQAIATTERLVVNSQKQVKALLQQLLIKPTARGDWTMVPISKISERIQRRADEDEALPVLMISSGTGFVRQDEKYSRFMAGKSVENYIALNRGEFAYNKGNSKLYEFGCVFPLRGYERGLVPNVYVCFKLSSGLNAAFYEHVFRADYLHDQLGALVNTGVRNNGLLNIRPADFLACQVPVPPLEDQHRIAGLLKTASTWVMQHERDLGFLKQEKVALMSQLLTGKRRVKLPEAEAEALA
jgi:type I restriction enzyme S subunit